MEDIINTILQDIYEIDGSLRNQERELKIIIAKLIASRPDTKFDENFKQRLYAQIMEKISQMKESPSNRIPLFINFTIMKKIPYILGGVAIGAIAILPVVFLMNNKGNIIGAGKKGGVSVFEQKIARVSDGAFGALLPPSQDQALQRAVSSTAPQGLGGGGGGAPYAQGVSGESAKAIAPMPPQEWVSFKYVYVGDPLVLTGEKMEVLKRVKGSGNSSDIADILKGMNFGVANLSTFTNTQVQSFNIIEDKEFGYMIDVNIPEGMVSISQNWMKWPQVQCADEKCYQASRIKIQDMLSDDDAIQIAGTFMDNHSMSLSSYGKPSVMNEWRLYYEKATGPEKENYYIPENITVLYPSVVNGKSVYDDYGNPVGLNVNIDVRQKKVSGVWNVASQNYQSSLYDTVSSADEIMKIVENGGMYGNFDSAAPKIQEVEIGTPTLTFLKVYNYKDGQSEELLVPAYYFPIAKGFENYQYMYRKAIVVPLVPDMLKNNNGGGPIRILEKVVPSVVVPPPDQPVIVPEKVVQ